MNTQIDLGVSRSSIKYIYVANATTIGRYDRIDKTITETQPTHDTT